ncbi:rhodanese-like domain-containing protein [Streptomyces sp. NBC_00190]|uniref:rhodanese-like domain-containing protein n=1 Tax=unclassified Streptomyces TaxID=2593676 RepID=UPI002E2C6FCE|nr:rhodanese-like domain-containing protein [Streptomyces sp. NBC_00190]WSZ42898.1 rhodanese-like domain-containing protein [Streptomyces sp. NBC_00868]
MSESHELFEFLKAESKIAGVPTTAELSATYFLAKLAAECDPSDVEHDISHKIPGVAVIDTRSAESYREAHIPGALNLPHRDLSSEHVVGLDRDVTYVTYGFGPDCNAGTKGAAKLAVLGFRVKEMIGGFEYWKRDGFPVESGNPNAS